MLRELDFGAGVAAPADLVPRTLAGDVYVIRHALQRFDLFDTLVDASLKGVAASAGSEAARRAAAEGFENIHNSVAAADIPAMTDAVYDAVRPLAPAFLRKFVGEAFPGSETLYYEESPNVRFHIPYDLAREHKASFNEFAKDHGQGKIAAHGPHRDSWLDCPANGVNLWFAIGPVRRGNGLTVYTDDYGRDLIYKRSGDIADGEKLHKPLTFDLLPGDCVMFHTDQIHGSELNRTDKTRFVISFRMTFGKPDFPNRHFHRYVHAGLAETPLKFAAHAPAMLQASYPRSLAQRIREKLSAPAPDAPARPPEAIGAERDGRIVIPLEDVAVGAVRGATPAICVARLSETHVVALTRRCPHSGGDLANGWIDEGRVVCPWHNLPFDPATGRSPCASVAPLRRVACEIVGGEIVVDPRTVLASDRTLADA